MNTRCTSTNALRLSLCLALVAPACGLSGASAPKAAQVQLTTSPLTETPELNHLLVELPWTIENTSAHPATVKAVDWVFEIEGAPAVSGTEPVALTVPTQSRESFETQLSLPLPKDRPTDTAEGALTIWRYNFNATFQISTHQGNEHKEAQWRGELFPPHPPKVSVEAEGARYSHGNYELNFFVTVENPNAFSLRLDELQYSLKLDGTPIHEGVLDSNRTLGPGMGIEFEINRTLSAHNHKALTRRLRGRSAIPYIFDSKVQAAGMKFAQPIGGELNFDR